MTAGKSLLLVIATCLLVSGCGTTLRVLNADTAESMVPWLKDKPTKAEVIERLGKSWRYADSSGRILVYSMIKKDGNLLLWAKHPGGEWPTHELVLVFDQNEVLKRYSLIEIN